MNKVNKNEEYIAGKNSVLEALQARKTLGAKLCLQRVLKEILLSKLWI